MVIIYRYRTTAHRIVKCASLFALALINCLQMAAQPAQKVLKDYFTALAVDGQFNGNVLVAENGKIVYEGSFGYADFENKIPNKKQTVFPIASISKTLTATATLQLTQNGKINVEDPVKKYLDWFPYDAVTVTHLLSHTSGLPPYNVFFDSVRKHQPKKVFTNADFQNGILSKSSPLLYAPGEKGNYDNINFIVLALIIEQVSRLSYHDYISKWILQPAGMKQTEAVPFGKQYRDSLRLPMARPYLYPHRYSDSVVRASAVPYVAEYWSAYNFSGFGDYVSTTPDLLKYDQWYYNHSRIGADLLSKTFTPAKFKNGKNNNAGFGLGWQVWSDSSSGKVVYHSGNATGLSCILIRNISKGQTVIVFDNIHLSNASPLGFAALKLLNGIQVPLPLKSIASVYGRVLVKHGADAARDSLYKWKQDTLRYYLNEDEINLLGYDFMGGVNNPNPFRFPEEHKYKEALETFKLNTELFPGSWNVWDSYGEILLKLGRKDEAAQMYKRSAELNPANEGGKEALKQLLNRGTDEQGTDEPMKCVGYRH